MRVSQTKLAWSMLILVLLGALLVAAQVPQGPQITFNLSENATPRPAVGITTAGGTFTTLVLNASSQNLKWKAYVGNVSGTMVLQDASGFNIYDWNLQTVDGEVYVSRNDSINWTGVRCADNASIAQEQTALSITHQKEDSINRTFNGTAHKGFYAGFVQINQSTCPAINTFVNGSRQASSATSAFQEILLKDNRNSLLYVAPLEQDAFGYKTGSRYDFQLIAPDYGNLSYANAVPYFFFVELS